MEDSLPNHHEDILQEKETIHYNIRNWFTNFSYASSHENSRSVDKEWENLEKISAWNLTKVRSKSEVKLEKIPAWDLTKVRSKKE